MIDYDAFAVSIFALFLALVVVIALHERSKRLRRRKIVPDPQPWWDEFTDGNKFVPDDQEARFRRAYAESDGDHRSYVDWHRGN